MGVIAKEEVNPAVPDRKRVLVRLDKGGQNWYLRLRQYGRYRYMSLGTPDLTEARRAAFLNPPECNPKQSLSIRKALMEFQESRQQLMDAPGDSKSIRLNTFKTYKVRVNCLIQFFEQQRIARKDQNVKTINSLTASDFANYRHWREKQGIMLTTIKIEINQINSILSWLHANNYLEILIRLPLPKIDPEKFRQPNRLLLDKEEIVLKQTLKRLSFCGDAELEKRWRLYGYWLEWLQDTFTRPHESRTLCFTDVKEFLIEGKTAVQFTTRPESKTGERLVYATSSVKSKLLKLYESWGLFITPASQLFLLPQGRPPSASWFSDMWKKLIKECSFNVKPRELTQYSLRHQGINTLLIQGVAPTKVADLAGHSLAIQQKIYKKYKLQDDHSVLRDDRKHSQKGKYLISGDSDLPFPWEIHPVTGEWFTD